MCADRFAVGVQKSAQVLEVGEYTVTRQDGGYWIRHKSGEGMQTSAEKFEELIHKFYQEEF